MGRQNARRCLLLSICTFKSGRFASLRVLVTDLEGAFPPLAFPEEILHISEEVHLSPVEETWDPLSNTKAKLELGIDNAGCVSNSPPSIYHSTVGHQIKRSTRRQTGWGLGWGEADGESICPEDFISLMIWPL